MTIKPDSSELIKQLLSQKNYAQIVKHCQDQIEMGSNIAAHYWNLGLALLLQGGELEAQLTWSAGIVLVESDQQSDRATQQLCEILLNESLNQEQSKEFQAAWAIRQYVREFDPNNFDNLVQIVYLSLHLNILSSELIEQVGIIEILQTHPSNVDIQETSCIQLAQNILASGLEGHLILQILHLIVPVVTNTKLLVFDIIAPSAMKFLNVSLELPVELLNICLQFFPQSQELLSHLTYVYIKHQQFSKAIDVSRQSILVCQNAVDSVLAEFSLLNSLVSAGGMWEEVLLVSQRQANLLPSLSQYTTLQLSSHLFISRFFDPYIKDDPKTNRANQNYLSSLCQGKLQAVYQEQVNIFTSRNQAKLAIKTSKPLKIGYLSNCLGTHSVGWLARWLFQYHDREQFEIYGYFINYYKNGADKLQDWFISQTHKAYRVGVEFLGTTIEICDQIFNDQIDILIDLDSITYVSSCEILSLKPAPIQVSWLGFDAPGIPAVDYFIADPYVLPAEADSYYSEKIWRLPQTYIAVDGFEFGVPTMTRSQLDIPIDSIVFFSGQSGYKRNPDTIRLQLQIIKNVPNSYLLIKGLADAELVQNLFYQLAQEQGVERNRLRFLPLVRAEAEHRANLTIADVVLDTYPYNGATTTLETLWMGIPMVTLVGQQFSARNSYTMMINAGITEGIAWTSEEYVEWGVKLGTDSLLRQEISWKLKKSRKSAPIWNARQFTKDIENAYTQMWEIYTN